MNGSRVTLPPDISRPFQVFVNGVVRTEGVDFEVAGPDLVFAEQLVPPRRMTTRSYARLMFWGRYGTEHTVDVAYQVNGRSTVASALAVRPPA